MRYAAIAFTVLVAIAAVAATGTPLTFSSLECNSSDPLDLRGSFNSRGTISHLDQHSNSAIAMLLSDEDDGGEDEEKDEKGEGDEKEGEDTGPDRIWGAAKLG